MLFVRAESFKSRRRIFYETQPQNFIFTPCATDDFIGYEFNKFAAQFLYDHNEKDILYLHCREFKNKEQIANFERDLGG